MDIGIRFQCALAFTIDVCTRLVYRCVQRLSYDVRWMYALNFSVDT